QPDAQRRPALGNPALATDERELPIASGSGIRRRSGSKRYAGVDSREAVPRCVEGLWSLDWHCVGSLQKWQTIDPGELPFGLRPDEYVRAVLRCFPEPAR